MKYKRIPVVYYPYGRRMVIGDMYLGEDGVSSITFIPSVTKILMDELGELSLNLYQAKQRTTTDPLPETIHTQQNNGPSEAKGYSPSMIIFDEGSSSA